MRVVLLVFAVSALFAHQPILYFRANYNAASKKIAASLSAAH